MKEEETVEFWAKVMALAIARYDVTYLLIVGEPKNEVEQFRYDAYLWKVIKFVERAFKETIQHDVEGLEKTSEELFDYVDNTLKF